MPEIKSIVVRSLTFTPAGDAEIEYLVIDDLRTTGVVLTHRIIVPPTRDFAEDIDNLHEQAATIISDALDFHANTPPLSIDDPEDLDDEDEEDDEDD